MPKAHLIIADNEVIWGTGRVIREADSFDGLKPSARFSAGVDLNCIQIRLALDIPIKRFIPLGADVVPVAGQVRYLAMGHEKGRLPVVLNAINKRPVIEDVPRIVVAMHRLEEDQSVESLSEVIVGGRMLNAEVLVPVPFSVDSFDVSEL